MGKQRQVQQRSCVEPRPHHERDADQDATARHHPNLARMPSGRATFNDRQRHGTHCHHEQQQANDIDSPAQRRLHRFCDAQPALPQRPQTHRHVDVKRPGPARLVSHPTAQAGAYRSGQSANGAPQTDDQGPALDREGCQHDGHRRRCEQRCAQGLQHARHDQPFHRGCQATGQRSSNEHGQAKLENTLAPMRICQPTGRDQHRGIDDGVCIEHPRQGGC